MKHYIALLFSLTLLIGLPASAQNTEKMGAFEITAHQRELAKTNEAGYPVLDAGRGNPNWINTEARYAYVRLLNFALEESKRTLNLPNMAGHASLEGIGTRFDKAMNPKKKADAFLIKGVQYATSELGLNKDALIKELVDGIIGDYYPSPSRVLRNTETILNAYLESTLYNGKKLAKETELFPTEGGSAAMSYVFESFNHNRILKPGDKIAIAAPIFTPYLQIPKIKNYGLVPINVASTSEMNWDVADEEIQKLENPEIKAFFLVNPSNPASHALSAKTIEKLKKVIEKNPKLIILTDDVYGTFVNNFQSVYSEIPYNTILVYSFSKLYGVTGHRIGLIAMHKDNLLDQLISELNDEDKNFLEQEYAIVVKEPSKMKFIDRVGADSRSIGLHHTSGLSTPEQVFMDLLALTHLVHKGQDPYIEQANKLVQSRYNALMKALELPADNVIENARYYTLINIHAVAKNRYGDAFAKWMQDNVSDLQFLEDLAKKKGTVLMYGPGFDSPAGYARVSLANLNEKDYVEIGRRIFELLDEYYQVSQLKKAA